MTIYGYIKAPPGHRLKRPTPPTRYARVFLSVFLLTLGIASFTTVVYPLISYQVFYAPKLKKSNHLISPLSDAPSINLEVKTAQAAEPQILPEAIGNALDFTDSEFWYPAKSVQKKATNKLIYTLSIPKVKITNAVVRNDHTDLKESLIHYQGTAAPGELGNGVIFGHSVLPQYFNPQDYQTIFSTLHTLKKGDEIIVSDQNANFRYIIEEMYETQPDDLTPLSQRYDNRYLTLITCTPPGTYLRRLIIKAVLI